MCCYDSELNCDSDLPPEITSQLPRTSVYVVKPRYMSELHTKHTENILNHTPVLRFSYICLCVSALSIEEGEERWVLETGRQYYLTVRIHGNKAHVVHLSQVVLHSHRFMHCLLHCIS